MNKDNTSNVTMLLLEPVSCELFQSELTLMYVYK
jgi:hypothetical protein